MKENPSLIPCHIPFEGATVEVLVNPNKTYGNETGRALIEHYSRPLKKPRPRHISSIHWEKEKYHNLTTNQEKTIGKASIQEILSLKFVPHAPQETYNLHLTQPLPETVKIGESTFDPVLILQCLEDITGKKLLCKERKVIKRCINNTYSVSIVPPTKEGILVLLCKSKAYVIAPRLNAED